jgi:DNA-binding response OmpR family regulator
MAKILVADDERDIRDLIGFTLRFAGHEVILAKDGEEALQLTRQEKPDLILLDVRMPKMTGYETCRLIKLDSVLMDIPVVFISAKGQESEIQAGYQAGAVEYMLKPFAPDELTARVADILAREQRCADSSAGSHGRTSDP